jgi:hypothetical protein
MTIFGIVQRHRVEQYICIISICSSLIIIITTNISDTLTTVLLETRTHTPQEIGLSTITSSFKILLL